MRKERTIEEVRAKDRERQAKWRAKNKVIARERKLYVYGKERMTELVEANRREAKKGQGESIKAPSVRNNVTPNVTSPLGEYTYDSDPTDARTPTERRQDEEQQAYRRRKNDGGGRGTREAEAEEGAVGAERAQNRADEGGGVKEAVSEGGAGVGGIGGGAGGEERRVNDRLAEMVSRRKKRGVVVEL
jgi:hypothetical protein